MKLSVKLRYYHIIIVIGLVLSGSLSVKGQQDDAGFWAGLTLKHQVTRRIAVTLNEQVRLYQNVSEVEQFLTDVGLEYELLSSLKVSVSYRLMSKNQLTYYSTRHRYYIDLSYKKKIKPLAFTLRQRVQSQVENVNSSEYGKIPEWYSRTKLTLKIDLDKKYQPYLATEFFYIIDNFKEEDHVFDKARYEVGIDYDFNRHSSLNLFYMIQCDILERKTRDFISGIGYTYYF